MLQDVQLTNLNAVMDTALTGVKFATTLMAAVISLTKKTAHIQQVNILHHSFVRALLIDAYL